MEASKTLNVAIDTNSGMSHLLDLATGLEDPEAANTTGDVISQTMQLFDAMEKELDGDSSESDLQYCLDIVDDIVSTLIYIHDGEQFTEI